MKAAKTLPILPPSPQPVVPEVVFPSAVLIALSARDDERLGRYALEMCSVMVERTNVISSVLCNKLRIRLDVHGACCGGGIVDFSVAATHSNMTALRSILRSVDEVIEEVSRCSKS